MTPVFKNEFAISDIINALLLLVNALLFLAALVGIFLTYRQIRDNGKTQRATFLKELYLTLYSDPVLREAYYLIEYDKFIYDDSFHGSEQEQLIDRLLTFVDLVCHLYYQRVLSKHEMGKFDYELIKIYSNGYILKYLKTVTEVRRAWAIESKPAFSFIRYCEELPQLQDMKLDDILIITREDIIKYAEDSKSRAKR